jgi:hypothetical protein
MAMLYLPGGLWVKFQPRGFYEKGHFYHMHYRDHGLRRAATAIATIIPGSTSQCCPCAAESDP